MNSFKSIDFAKYVFKIPSLKDIIKVLAAIFFISVNIIFIPKLYKIIFSHLELHVYNFNILMIFSSIILISSVTISVLLMEYGKSLLIENIQKEIKKPIRNDLIIDTLPAHLKFLKQYSLNNEDIINFSNKFVECVFSGIIIMLISIIYIVQLYIYMPWLMFPKLAVPVIIILISLFISFIYKSSAILKYHKEIINFLSLIGTVIIFAESFKNSIDLPDFMFLFVYYGIVMAVYSDFVSTFVKLMATDFIEI